MAEKKNSTSRIQQILTSAKTKKRLVIIDMPEEMETAPHWLVWVALIALIGLIGSVVWQSLANNSTIQAYLPFLFS